MFAAAVIKAWSDADCQEYIFLSFCEDNHISVPMIAITAASVIVIAQGDPAMSSEHLFCQGLLM